MPPSSINTDIKKRRRSPLLNWWIKGGFILLFSCLLIYQISNNNNLDILWASFISQLQSSNLLFLALAIGLMPVNWAIESWKWRSLVLKYEELSFINSYKAILAGLTVGIVTPGRIGEYGGRVLYVSAKNNWKAVITTFVTSISQNLVNLSVGIICAIAFVAINYGMSKWILMSSLLFAFGFMLIAYVFYFHLDSLKKFFKRITIPFLSDTVAKHIKVLKLFSKKDLAFISFMSLLRYCTYSFQYVLLLYFFGIEASVLMLFIGVSTIFLVQSSLPLPPVFSVFARSEIALLVWGIFSANEIAILSSSFGLWIINLLIPACIGLALSLNKNIVKSFGYDH